MKALTLHNLDRKTEAWTVGKQGLKMDLTSQICWHVFGLMHRREANYAESVKSYAQALKHSPDVSFFCVCVFFFLGKNINPIAGFFLCGVIFIFL
jgi:hypothetical protein